MARQESKRKESLAFRDADRPRSRGLPALALHALAAGDRALTRRRPMAAADEMRKDIAHGREM